MEIFPKRFQDKEGDWGTAYGRNEDGNLVVEWDCRPGVLVTPQLSYVSWAIDLDEINEEALQDALDTFFETSGYYGQRVRAAIQTYLNRLTTD